MSQLRFAVQLGYFLWLLAPSMSVCAEPTGYSHLFGEAVTSPADAESLPSGKVSSRVVQVGNGAFEGRRQLDAYSSGLRNLPAAGAPQLRGAREVAIYAQVSPAVVLILNGDTLGSGTLINESGLIVSNYHVVEGAKTVGVIFKPAAEGQPLTKAQVITGTVIRVDQVSDLALVRVSEVPSQARSAHLASISSLQVGDDVHAIGHPTGEAWTYTRGIVSQIRRHFDWDTGDNIQHHADVIQTQTPINPGNSGGPLLNNDAEVIGVNSFKGEGEGLNFAVSGDAVQALLELKSDRLARPIQTKTSAKCEPKTLKTWRTTDPPATNVLVDVGCTGHGDMVVQTPDDKSQPVYLLLDSKHQGKIDIVMVCPKRDGYPTYALYDTTGSGKPDLIGYFHNHEFTPYKVEPYAG